MFNIPEINLQEASVYITGLAVLTALLVPYLQDRLTRKPNKSKLCIEEARMYDESPDNEYNRLSGQPEYLEVFGRLRIYNDGKHAAKNVGANIEKVIRDGEVDKDFLPLPLMWTHSDKAITRDIMPKQQVYLDVIRAYTSDDLDTHGSYIATPVAKNDEAGRGFIGDGETLLELVIYQESGQLVRKTVKVVRAQAMPFTNGYTITLR